MRELVAHSFQLRGRNRLCRSLVNFHTVDMLRHTPFLHAQDVDRRLKDIS